VTCGVHHSSDREMHTSGPNGLGYTFGSLLGRGIFDGGVEALDKEKFAYPGVAKTESPLKIQAKSEAGVHEDPDV